MDTSRDSDTITFTVKGQVVIPRRMRKLFDIETGTRALVISTEEGILIKPLTSAAIQKAHGMLKRAGGPTLVKEWAEHKREELALEEDRHGRARSR